MPRKLSSQQVQQYEANGCLYPISVMSAEEVAECRRNLDSAIARLGGDTPEVVKKMQFKVHLLFPWLHRIVSSPAILDAVEDVLGPDILVWNSGFLNKKPRDPKFVSWHQDATYWGLEPPAVITAWVAFSDSNALSGCVRVVPGSHKWEQLPHVDTFSKDNMLSRGQEIAVKVEEHQAADMVLKPGEMSLHHVKVVHGSKPNNSDQPRIGFIINYIAAYVKQIGFRETATLVRGTDKHKNFDHEPAPVADLDSGAIRAHDAAMELQKQNTMRGT